MGSDNQEASSEQTSEAPSGSESSSPRSSETIDSEPDIGQIPNEALLYYFDYMGDHLDDTKNTLITRTNILTATISIFIGSIGLAINSNLFSIQLLNLLFMLPMICYLISLAHVLGIIKAHPEEGIENEKTLFHFEKLYEEDINNIESSLKSLDMEKLTEMMVIQFSSLSMYLDMRYKRINKSRKYVMIGIILETFVLIFSFIEQELPLGDIIPTIFI